MSSRAALLVLFACLGCATAPMRIVPGQSLDVSLGKLGGGEVSLASLRGQVVLVDVWASWCRPCTKAMPFYEDLQRALGSRGLTIVAIDVDEDERAARAFLREANVENLLVLRDAGGRIVAPRFGLSRLPTEFFLDRAGHVRMIHEGFVDADRASFRREVEELLDESHAAR